jgi:hypothetical protein
MRRIIAVASAMALAIVVAPAAIAQTKIMFTQANGAPLSTAPTVSAGENLYFVLSGFPTGKGLYAYEAVQPSSAGSSPTYKDSSRENTLWISTANGATSSPTAVITFKVNNGNSWGADCAHQQCGLWFEFDHTNSTDRSEDQFVPFTFTAASSGGATSVGLETTNKPKDTISVKINGVLANNTVLGTIAYRQVLTFAATAESGSPVKLISYTPDLCPVSGNTVTALKGSGQCDIAASSPGNATLGAKESHFGFNLAPGTQTANLGHISFKVKVGDSWTLAKVTNFGESISYKALTKNCSISGVKLKAVKAGACKISASAPATSNYAAFRATDSFVINKK